jgi:hypothetical protein
LAGLGAGFDVGFAAAVFDAGLAAGFATGAVFAAAGFAAGFALAFAGALATFGLAAALAGFAAATAGFEAVPAFAFAGAVVFVAFATSSLPQSFVACSMLHRLDRVRRPPLQQCRVFPGNPVCHLSIATIGGRASLAPTAERQRFAVKICPVLLP